MTFFHSRFHLWIRMGALLLALLILTSVAPVTAMAETYPYPKLLEYEDLDRSFNQLAKSKILPEYRAYVLTAIKYHIEAKRPTDYNTTDYRVAKNLLKAFNANADGNVIFFFDGCSINLKDSTPCLNGFMKDGKRYNRSAVCVVVQLNENGRPEIVFATCNASTIADNLRMKSINNGNDISITRDGIYSLKTTNHRDRFVTPHEYYAAMNIVIPLESSVRIPDLDNTEKGTYYDRATGIDIHSRGSYELVDNDTRTYNSTGCFNIGSTMCDAEYKEFMRVTTGVTDPKAQQFTSGVTTSMGYTAGSDLGVVVVDHSNYKTQLAIITGNDNPDTKTAKTGAEIAAMITDRSEQWHEDIMARIAEETPADAGNCDVVFLIDGSSSMSQKNFKMMADAAKEIVNEANSLGKNWSFAVVPFGQTFEFQKVNSWDLGFYSLEENILSVLDNLDKPRGATYLADTLRYVESALDERNSSEKVIILMSDGTANGMKSGISQYNVQGDYTTEMNAFYNEALRLMDEKGYQFYTMGVHIFWEDNGEPVLQALASHNGTTYQRLESLDTMDLDFVDKIGI